MSWNTSAGVSVTQQRQASSLGCSTSGLESRSCLHRREVRHKLCQPCYAQSGVDKEFGPLFGQSATYGWSGSSCYIGHRRSSPAVVQQRHEELEAGAPSISANGAGGYDKTVFVAETLLPTKTGRYRLRGYRHSVDGGRTFTEPACIMTGEPENAENVPIRVHDACYTSEVLGSLKCDCAEQLSLAMEFIQDYPPGLIIYLQQEGRGIGLANKIAAYSLQEKGLDTVDANRALGLPDDCREYTSVRNILKDLGIKSVRLMTNNPRKIELLRGLGVKVTDRIPCVVEAQEYNSGYLLAKQSRMSHDLDGSYCFWNHDGEPAAPLASVEDLKLQDLLVDPAGADGVDGLLVNPDPAADRNAA